MKRIVVTGMGCVTPLGAGVEYVWRRLLAGASGIRRNERIDVSDLGSQVAGLVPRGSGEGEFDIDAVVPRKEQRRLEDFVSFVLAAAAQAVAQAGLETLSDAQRERAGVLIGSGIGGVASIADNAVKLHEQGPRRLSPYFIPSSLINEASGGVSIRHGLKGPNHAVVTACATGAHALGDAMRLIQFGDADVMVAGGTEGAVHRLTIAGFTIMRALSTHYNESPSEASRPWDAHRDGFVLGEGAAVLVLEELEHARRRGATILGEIIGYGLSGDAYHVSAPDPSGAGALRAMRSALRNARLDIDELDYVNAHATSTPLGDPVELEALARLCPGGAEGLSVSSTKSAVGHLLGAAGAVEAVFTLLALRDQVAPPTLNLHEPCDPTFDLVPLRAKPRRIRHALSNSFGFGGTNAALVFGPVP